MGNNKFKIKFQISKESQLEPQVLMDKIASQLMMQSYIITDRNINAISFTDDNWQFRSKHESFKKIDEGDFKIIVFEKNMLIKFTYYISFLPELLITSILLFFGFLQSFFILIIAVPLLIQLVFRIDKLKKVSEELILSIVK
jgi:hypothetical protein